VVSFLGSTALFVSGNNEKKVRAALKAAGLDGSQVSIIPGKDESDPVTFVFPGGFVRGKLDTICVAITDSDSFAVLHESCIKRGLIQRDY
jgi:ABC-type nitrate/sulfonate/bicarbonate transport system substrate-binding protein